MIPMKSRKEINRKYHEATYCPVQRKAKYKAKYCPIKRRLQYLQQKAKKAQQTARQQVGGGGNVVRNTARPNNATVTLEGGVPTIEDIDIPIDIQGSIREAIKWDQDCMRVEGKPETFRRHVCIICDRLIIGCETCHNLAKADILNCVSKFSVDGYNEFYDIELKQSLVQQYEVDGLEGMLLSPRATPTKKNDGSASYTCCSNCYNSINASKRKKDVDNDNPPKHAISNGFAIGHVPNEIMLDEEITEEMCALLAPVRPYGFLFSYSAGAHKSIKGRYSFFEMDVEHTGSVFNHFNKTGTNPLVYVVLNGRMTPKQKEKVRNRAELDTEKMLKLLTWFISDSGHPSFEGITPPTDCPRPVIIQDSDNANNTDEEMDPAVEHTFESASFHFASNHDPNDDTGVY